MKQTKIKALLVEAANPECSWERRNEIQCLLVHASPAMQKNGVYKICDREAGMLLVLKKLYVSTIQKKPELLPSLFPVFAIISGDRDEGMICASEIDWLLVD